ncbi:hypothetical protein [Amycolatopsis sp. lyj-23]|uniref:hypothetical protein n=1 Tax=Amycolatopsis sp. lyj-23 TaxID=2789283 RepID=UPI00397CE9A5
MTSNATSHQAGGFVVDRRGLDLVIRRPGEAGPHGRPAPVPGEVFVWVSAGAAEEPALITHLPSLLHRHAMAAGDVRSVRIGLPDLGADALVSQALADALNIAIFAPVGEFCPEPGAVFYAVSGWRHFRPGVPPVPGGHRYPVPRWEAVMPAAPLVVRDTVLEPVPAGVLVRGPGERPATPGGPAFAVPADPEAARIVVQGLELAPAAVAAAVAGLPRVPSQLVVLPSAGRTRAWLGEFAKALGRDVVVAGGFGPFASLLRQHVDGSQEVIEAAPPPAGWERRGHAGYRLGAVAADVVPSGLALHTGPADPAAAKPAFDPHGWTLHIGTPGEPVGPELLAAVEAVLKEIDAQTQAAARLRLAGRLDDRARELLGDLPPDAVSRAPVPPAGGPVPRRPPMPVRPGPAPGGVAPSRHEEPKRPVAPPTAAHVDRSGAVTAVPPGDHPRPVVAGERPRPVDPRSAVPRPLLVSGPPVATVSGAPGGTEPVAPVPAPPDDAGIGETARPAPPAAVEANSAPTAEIASTPAAEPGPAEVPGSDTAQQPPAEPAAPPAIATGAALVIADRASTAAEQARFTTAAGEAYSEALATVNAALATWPSMRRPDPGAKADYVAVCLYLGSGAGSSTDLGAAVRNGHDGELAGQVPCLVSGLRRLPTHRRAVLRQGRPGQAPESTAKPGTVLTEPGFLVGTTDLDVTVPDANLDVLIWPASARRTAELRIGRPANEVVFFAGARFKALAVRTVEPAEGAPAGDPAAPRTAALFRELAPGEQASVSGELDERDLAALAKLDEALDRRHRSTLRVVDDSGVVGRVTTSLLEWQAEAVSRATANHTATLAS